MSDHIRTDRSTGATGSAGEGDDGTRDTSLVPTLPELAAELLYAVNATVAEGPGLWTDLVFNRLALHTFQAQYEHVDAYRRWCDHELASRGCGPDDVQRWQDVPALPIEAFKRTRVAGHAPELDVAIWESSTTTGAVPSRHHLHDLSLYESSLVIGAVAALMPEPEDHPLLAVQLMPSTADAPHSSLGHMLDTIRLELCEDGGVHADARGVHVESAWDRLEGACAAGDRVLLLGPSFALVQLFGGTADRAALQLPQGSRVMDTGGYKGRTRELTRQELLAMIEQRLGVPAQMCENEYGMSELSTQAWLGTVASASGRPLPGMTHPDGRRWQPPWMRTRVVDPQTLQEVGEGELGLLVHHDLANVWTCSAIRTDDVGIRRGHTYELAGRAPGAELRGCSLRFEDVAG